jgi:hypothetical protein
LQAFSPSLLFCSWSFSIVICHPPQFAIHNIVGCSNVLVFVVFNCHCCSSSSIVHCYSFCSIVHHYLWLNCSPLLVTQVWFYCPSLWLLLLFGLVGCYWSTLVFVHGSSALVATCHSSPKKFNTKICLLSLILEKLEPEVILKS